MIGQDLPHFLVTVLKSPDAHSHASAAPPPTKTDPRSRAIVEEVTRHVKRVMGRRQKVEETNVKRHALSAAKTRWGVIMRASTHCTFTKHFMSVCFFFQEVAVFS